MDRDDPYRRLRPEVAPLPDELCACTDAPPITLQDHLSSNPLTCVRCHREVPPEQVDFAAELADRLAAWRSLHRALYLLELDSSDYEAWARDRLADPDGRVNVLGLELVAELNRHRRTYYWWFEPVEDEAAPRARCPRCARALTPREDHSICDACSILVTTA